MNKRVVIVHGWEGSPKRHWFPWLKRELEQRDFMVLTPAMPDSISPTMKKWVPYLIKTVGTPNKNTYLVGHSLGCITILRYLETLKGNEKIGGVILVAGFGHDLEYPNYKGEISSFFQSEVNWGEIKKRCPKFVAIHSENDPWVPVKHNKLFQEKLNAKSFIQQSMGHYNDEDGVTELPVVLDELLRISSC